MTCSFAVNFKYILELVNWFCERRFAGATTRASVGGFPARWRAKVCDVAAWVRWVVIGVLAWKFIKVSSIGDVGGQRLEYYFSISLLNITGDVYYWKLEEELRIQFTGYSRFEHIVFFRLHLGHIQKTFNLFRIQFT